MRLALRIRDGVWNPRAVSLETRWRDPSTPTFAQKADAAVKLHAEGLLPTEMAWNILNFTAVEQEQMKQMQADAMNRVMDADLAAFLGPKPPQAQQQLPESVPSA